jgi:hypothetical protein
LETGYFFTIGPTSDGPSHARAERESIEDRGEGGELKKWLALGGAGPPPRNGTMERLQRRYADGGGPPILRDCEVG